jgi:hypothetical protein
LVNAAIAAPRKAPAREEPGLKLIQRKKSNPTKVALDGFNP